MSLPGAVPESLTEMWVQETTSKKDVPGIEEEVDIFTGK